MSKGAFSFTSSHVLQTSDAFDSFLPRTSDVISKNSVNLEKASALMVNILVHRTIHNSGARERG